MGIEQKIKTLGKVGLILLITLGLTEVLFRTYNFFQPSFLFHDSSYNRFRGQPLAPEYDFRLNSQGFKDVEFQIDKDPEVTRILGLGDSFAYGVVPYEYKHTTHDDQEEEEERKRSFINSPEERVS